MDKRQMREDLAISRKRYKNHTMITKLKMVPFDNCSQLFNLDNIPKENFTRKSNGYRTYRFYPCTIFSRQLVLKIVDELLDDNIPEMPQKEKYWIQSFENQYLIIFDMEVSKLGLLWCMSVRDDFRHMWE